jgi:hypothetical protein
MCRWFLIPLLCAVATTAFAEPSLPAIIPKPVRLERQTGSLVLENISKIVAEPQSEELLAIGRRLSESLVRITGRTVPVDDQAIKRLE